MTNANGLSGKRNRGFSGLFGGMNKGHISHMKYEPVNDLKASRVSVGFDGSRYTRRSVASKSSSPLGMSNKKLSAAEKRSYIAPDAEVLLMPGAIERAAVEELFSSEPERDTKKQKLSLKVKIKKAAHRESESYTMYGVETKEIFTEEIEIDVMDGAAFAAAGSIGTGACAASGDLSSRRFAAAETLERFRCNATVKFRDFAYKVNHLRLGSDKNAG